MDLRGGVHAQQSVPPSLRAVANFVFKGKLYIHREKDRNYGWMLLFTLKISNLIINHGSVQ